MVLDMQNRVVDINPAGLRVIGRIATQVIGKTPTEIMPEIGELIARFRDIQETSTEIVLPLPGQTRTFQLSVSLLDNRQGVITGRLFVLHEITELKQASEQIRTQNEALVTTNHALEIAQREAEEASRLKSEFLAT